MTTPQSSGREPDGASRTPCPHCQAREVMLGTRTDRFVYLRCAACAQVWAIPERRRFVRVRVDQPGAASERDSNETRL